jgi:two-component sensor histidine kinase
MNAGHLNLPDPTLSLSRAIVASSAAPLLLLDADLKVIAASGSFYSAFHLGQSAVEGRSLFDLGAGEWNIRQLKGLLEATAAGSAEVDAYEMDLKADGHPPRALVVSARKLEYGAGEAVRLLVTLADVTDARAAARQKDQLLESKAVLLKELQHRVANSLQIIASVLLQSARKQNSEDSRSVLHDAHGRVLSVAALQQQLSASSVDKVELRSYFSQLCASIGASMIHDHDLVSLVVDADDAKVDPDASISLGLIVTELVINSLKHAFPHDRKGLITVAYRRQGAGWTLTIADDGVGMPADPKDAVAGLGTSIVQALARQLDAEVEVTDVHPGACVTIRHAAGAEAGAGAEAV